MILPPAPNLKIPKGEAVLPAGLHVLLVSVSRLLSLFSLIRRHFHPRLKTNSPPGSLRFFTSRPSPLSHCRPTNSASARVSVSLACEQTLPIYRAFIATANLISPLYNIHPISQIHFSGEFEDPGSFQQPNFIPHYLVALCVLFPPLLSTGWATES